MKIVKRVMLWLFIAVILVSLSIYFFLRHTLPKLEGEIRVKGIIGEILIKRNRWGVPGIDARNAPDLFFAIGFIHAQDRLFQMDLARRLAMGRLSEVLGERALEVDKYQKDLLIEESIEKSVTGIRPGIKELLNYYCRGVNHFIRNRILPPEFNLLGYRPEEWNIKDMLSISKSMEVLLSDSGSELYNFKVLQALGRERARKLISGFSGTTIMNQDETALYFRNRTLNKSLAHEISLSEHHIGSNNWVIAGQKTFSGRPILANDPHLPNVFPSYFYQIYGKGGDWLLSGLTLPGIPFIVIGRNARLGWGFTDIGTDVIDYFVLKINPENTDQYWCDGRWRDFDFIEKKIKVKGKGEIIHRIRISCFGPVQEESGVMLARHSLLLYPSSTLSAFYGMNLSRNTDQFLEAVKKFSSPGQNIVFADIEGNIGYFPSGAVPLRGKGSGMIPVEVDSIRDKWQGFMPEDDKPFLFNPSRGYIVTANNPVIPDSFESIFSRSRYLTFRADRIDRLIRSAGKITPAINIGIQTDSFLESAAFLIDQIKSFHFESTEASFVLDQLTTWDFTTTGGPAPYLFYRFEEHLARHLFADHIKADKLKNIVSTSWIYRILGYGEQKLDKMELAFWSDNVDTPQKESFYQIVQQSLVDTCREYKRQVRSKEPTWETIHTLYYRHPLGSLSLLKPLLNRGTYFMPGGQGCILTASFNSDRNFRISHLSAFRMIIDFADFSGSLLVNSSGQSGHFMSPHYDDQIKLYVDLKYRSMESFKRPLKVLKLTPAR